VPIGEGELKETFSITASLDREMTEGGGKGRNKQKYHPALLCLAAQSGGG
jgi:hypothetical protein